ncbi:MAG: DJ-1/PfpI family protein [Bacteroidales bacterium]|nr:DJ-1/PfpI family protein [Bacteroidales bacterium]
MKGTFIFLADGFEEVEAIATLDILRRGGVDVRTVSIYDNSLVEGAHGLQLISDLCWEDFEEIEDDGAAANDFLIFPGGMPGAKNLAEFEPLMEVLRRHWEAGGGVAAICASPAVVLAPTGLFAACEMTCYDGFEGTLEEAGIHHTAVGSLVNGRLVTGRGPGYAADFALDVLASIKDRETAAAVTTGFTPR